MRYGYLAALTVFLWGVAVLADTKLSDIEKNPEAFAERIVEIDGWGGGWMANAPETLEGRTLRHASGNTGSRNDGTFTDGNLTVLYPVPLRFSGRMHIKAKVSIDRFGWRLRPIRNPKRR